jgi:hypothetical protein
MMQLAKMRRRALNCGLRTMPLAKMVVRYPV